MKEGRDLWWHELVAQQALGRPCPTGQMDAEDPLRRALRGHDQRPRVWCTPTTGGYQVRC